MESGTLGRELEVELAQFAREPGAQLANGFAELSGVFPPIGSRLRSLAAIGEDDMP